MDDLQQLSGQDAPRSKAVREAGRCLLAAARARAQRAGALQLDARLRHGEFVATVAEMVPDAALFVLGEHHHAGAGAREHTDHRLGQPIRAVTRPVLVATVGTDTVLAQRQLDEASQALAAAGRVVDTLLVPGEPQRVLPDLVQAHGPALLVMGAYGQSRLRQLVLGSTTSTLLRLSNVPVRILR